LCERKKRAAEALSYNALVQSWPEITGLARDRLRSHLHRQNYCKTAPNIREFTVQSEQFDLNDIQHEPTDQQLEALMTLVATEARRRAEAARQELMARLRTEIAAANRLPESA
jgi:hypothetical protein